jgi:Gpi18-like mannosyltransferase
MRKNSLLYWCFGIALVLRLLLILNPGFEADISFWKSWGLATYDKGIVEGMKVTNNNYPTPFAYILGGMVHIYSIFADPHNFNEFWKNTNLLFLTISKLVPIIADFGIAALLLYIGKNSKRLGFPDISTKIFDLTYYELAAVAYLLSPLSLIDGAWWGQVDSLGVCIFLTALVLALKRQPFLAGTIFMLAMMTKLQNMIYGPVFFLFIWQSLGFTGLVKAIGGAMFGFVGLNSEFFLSRNADRVFASLTENYDYFPWMSLNAYNLWWIVTSGRGMITSDKLSIIGMVNAKTIGLITFSSFYLFATLRQFIIGLQQNSKLTLKHALESLIIVNAAFFLFQTQSHDRYAFPLSVFLLLWAPFYIAGYNSLTQYRLKIMAWMYTVYTIFYFYNLHTALIANYPNNGIPILSALTQPIFTIPTALILLGLFGVFLIQLIHNSQVSKYVAILSCVCAISAVSMLNRPLLTKQPVNLTKITPFVYEQGYGRRQVNKSINSYIGGPNKWNRLSVQYVFYPTGIGTHANSREIYDLNRKFTKFTTDVGIDTESGTKASAIFEIYGDDKLLYRSEVMGRFSMPAHAEVSVKGVKYLKLITTDAGDGIFDDHTDWLNPMLWP